MANFRNCVFVQAFCAIGLLASAAPPTITNNRGDIVVEEVQPSGSMYDLLAILATVNRLYPNASLKLINMDSSGGVAVIRLNQTGDHLFLVSPVSVDDLSIQLGVTKVDEMKLLYVRQYRRNLAFDLDGNLLEVLENKDIVDEVLLGGTLSLDDRLPFKLSCHVLGNVGGLGGFLVDIVRNLDGKWSARVQPAIDENGRLQVDSARCANEGESPDGEEEECNKGNLRRADCSRNRPQQNQAPHSNR